MKKKYRNIIVNGVKYAWMITSDDGDMFLQIWLKKYQIYFDYAPEVTTPGYVRGIIDNLTIN